MDTKVVTGTITIPELRALAHEFYGDIIKGVVDIEQELLGVGGEFHSEIERILIEEHDSKREHTWGINLLLDTPGDEFIEFDSMINLKPALGNRSRDVENETLRQKIRAIITKRVTQ